MVAVLELLVGRLRLWRELWRTLEGRLRTLRERRESVKGKEVGVRGRCAERRD